MALFGFPFILSKKCFFYLSGIRHNPNKQMASTKVAFRFWCLRLHVLKYFLGSLTQTKNNQKISLKSIWERPNETSKWMGSQCDLEGWFFSLICLQNQREISLHHCFRGRFKTRFFFTNISLYFPEIMKWKNLQLPYNIITTCLVCERVRKKERQIFNHELHKRKVGKWY